MNTLQCLHRLKAYGAGVLLSLLLGACSSSNSSSPSAPINPNVGAGWVQISSAWSDSQNAYLSGTAFVSPTSWSCCTGTAQDTGVTVRWTNSTTGISGQASQQVSYSCFFSSCWPSTNRWYATIPLSSGGNQIDLVAEDSSGNIGRASFAISPGTIYPAVILTDPANGATVGVNTSISASFSDNIDPASINSDTFRVTNGSSALINGTYNVVEKTVTFVPSIALEPYSGYYIDLSTGIKNLQGNPLLESYHWSFYTGGLPDTTPPTVSSVVPLAGASNISVATNVEATFSEPMNPETITTATFTVKDAGNNSIGGTVAYVGSTARFTPTVPFASSSTYTATITTGARDEAGNALVSDYVWNFTPGTLQGALDTAFGAGGIVTSSNLSSAHALAADGTYLYVVGNSITGPIEKRNLSDGVLVSGFGTNGVVSTAWNTSPRAFAIDSSFMYVVGLDASISSTYQWRIEKRSLTDGSLVAGFGNNGVITGVQSVSAFTEPRGIAVDSAYMYIVGFVTGPTTKSWRIEKRNLSDGSLVTSFGTNGVVTSGQSSTYPVGNVAIAIDSTSMYVAGQGSNNGQVEKRNLSDGALDAGFGINGIITVPYPVNSIATDNASIYLNEGSRVEKRNLSDGTEVSSFGSNGVLSVSDMYVSALTADSSFLYLGGYDYFSGYEWRIEKRNWSDGTLVPAFGTGGALTSGLSPASQVSLDAIITDTTSLYAAGYTATLSSWQWRLEKRIK